MFLQIYNLNNSTNENPICILKQGEHVIGRGDLLEVSIVLLLFYLLFNLLSCSVRIKEYREDTL